MKKTIILALVLIFFQASLAGGETLQLTLREIIDYALEHNPDLRRSGSNVEIEKYGIRAAKAERMPKLDFGTGWTLSRFDSPITPISGPPSLGGFPEFDDSVYDLGIFLTLPLYQGGRLYRGVTIAEMKKEIAEEYFKFNQQELVYNLSSLYYKSLQFEKLLASTEETVRQLEAYRKNVALFLEAGTVPEIDLLKTDVELARAGKNVLITRNNLEGTLEMLKVLMGFEETAGTLSLAPPAAGRETLLEVEEAVAFGLDHRPDYQAAVKKYETAREKVKWVKGKRLPALSLDGGYVDRSGNDLDFEEDWHLAMRLSVPLFDGGLIKAETNQALMEVEKIREEERSLRLDMTREVKTAYLNIEDARKRIELAESAIGAARENLRIELLKYETGTGTSSDVIDAQAAFARTDADYYQALYEEKIALASLRKAMGAEIYEKEESR